MSKSVQLGTDCQGRSIANRRTGRFNLFNFLDQIWQREHDAVADKASNTRAHDAGGDQVKRGFDAVDYQRMASVVTALKADNSLCAIGQQIDDLTLPFIAPLSADDNYGFTHVSLFN